jgi:hypothetical protein
MNASTRVPDKESQPNSSGEQVSILTVGLSVAGAVLLGTRFHFVEELLLFLAALAVLLAVGTAICLLIVVVDEGGRRIVCKFNEAKRAKALSLGGVSAG